MDEMRCILESKADHSQRRVHSLMHRQDTIPKLRKHCRAGGNKTIMQHLVAGSISLGVQGLAFTNFKPAFSRGNWYLAADGKPDKHKTTS